MTGAWELTVQVWQWYLKNFRNLLKVSLWLLVSLPFMLPASVQSVVGLTSSGEVLSRTPEHFKVFLFFITLGTIISVATSAIVRPALIVTIFAQSHRKNLSWRKAFQHARAIFWHYILVMIMVATSVALGFTALFIPGVIVGVYLMMSETVSVLEGKRHWRALKRSYDLVKGRFWAVLWRFLLPIAIFYVGVALINTLIIRAPLALLRVVAVMGSVDMKIIITPFLVIGAILSILTLPLFLAVPVFIFKELRVLKK